MFIIDRTKKSKEFPDGPQEYYFVQLARNGQVIATSEVYESKQAAKKGIRSVRMNAFGRVIDNDYYR